MRRRSLLIAVVVCVLALGAAPTAAANEADNALVNICNVRGTLIPGSEVGLPDTVVVCDQPDFDIHPVADTAESASHGYLAAEKVCEAAGGLFGLLTTRTEGTLRVIGWTCHLSFFP
jgi:hypothetical protein